MMRDFKEGKFQVLICTDALARGIDVSEFDDAAGENAQSFVSVVHYDIPSFKTFIHRSGRTARAGRVGQAVAILSKHEARYFKSKIEKHGFTQQTRKIKITDIDLYQSLTEEYKNVLNKLRQ
jgi:superfamily II DNA/RNA helicase